ncbi:MAG: enoyl-CoA hydratase/isomerase family protein [Alphaproteobacteria bacterium]
MIDLDRVGPVFVLRMQSGENRFNPHFVAAWNAALDEVEASDGDAALVTTGGEEKYFSNGLDLDWLTGPGAAEAGLFLPTFIRLLGRIFAFPLPTVAAVNGHAFAGGGMLALAHDFRVMRADRGFFCLNEIDLRMPLAPGMAALITARLQGAVLRDVVLTGRRYGGADATAAGIADEAVPQSELLNRAIHRATALATKDRRAYATLKRNLHGPAIATLEEGRLP